MVLTIKYSCIFQEGLIERMLVIWSTLLWYLLRWSCMLWFSHWASWWYKYRSNTRLFLITCINLSRWDERWYQCHSDFSFVTFYIRYLHLFQKWFWIIPFLPFQYNELYCFSPLTAWHTHIGLISYPNILKYDLNFGIINIQLFLLCIFILRLLLSLNPLL